MKKVFIKYNPYKLETEITVDGKKLKENSTLGNKSAKDSRFQEWVEELPQILVDEYNDNDFDILFHGTLLDYEDLTSVVTDANKHKKITVKCQHIPAIKTSDKEALIDEVFAEIQHGPFDELRDIQIINAFQQAKSEDFPVCVVATMSAGKSTLINAMLGSKLMPSKQEACTAIITRIKDTSSDNIPFRAEVYDRENHLIETHEKLTLSIMDRLNQDENVSVIKVFGNIPFVSSEDVSLVLIDTPGPNNARNERHRKVQSEFLSESSKVLVLYIMTGEFGTDDDNSLLKRVAESMAVGGKQSKDRFIFVVNKLDDRKKEDGDTNQTLEKVRSYLKNHGVINPNLFPAAALPALNIRMILSKSDIDVDSIDETEIKVKKLNRNDALHFETYAALPASIQGEIKGQLDTTRSKYKGPENENQMEALIHTGVVSIEAAIRQYVQKYAKTAKITNIVETFMNRLRSLGVEEENKRILATHQEESDKIVKHIDLIRAKMNSAEGAKNFKKSVDDAVKKVNDDSKELVETIIQKFQTRITKRFDDLREMELDKEDAFDEVERLKKFSKKLEPEFEVELDNLIRSNLEDTSKALLNGYRNKLASLAEEIDIKNLVEFKIEPLKLMSGSTIYDDFSIRKLVTTKTVEDGEEYIKNYDKKWYKPWTWFQEDGYYRKKYKDVDVVTGSKLAQEFISPIERNLSENGDGAIKYAKNQSKKIADIFKGEFERLDSILKTKLNELERCATDKENVDELIRETESKLLWLEQIKSKVEKILDI